MAPCIEGLGPRGQNYASYIGAPPVGFLQVLREGGVEDKTAGAGAVRNARRVLCTVVVAGLLRGYPYLIRERRRREVTLKSVMFSSAS